MLISALSWSALNNGEGNVEVYVCKMTAAIYRDHSDKTLLH